MFSTGGQTDLDSRATPLVSVILTTYNRAQLVPRAVESVLRQTFTDFELIIIVDDTAIVPKHQRLVEYGVGLWHGSGRHRNYAASGV